MSELSKNKFRTVTESPTGTDALGAEAKLEFPRGAGRGGGDLAADAQVCLGRGAG